MKSINEAMKKLTKSRKLINESIKPSYDDLEDLVDINDRLDRLYDICVEGSSEYLNSHRDELAEICDKLNKITREAENVLNSEGNIEENKEIKTENKDKFDMLNSPLDFKYQMLSRLESDCKYFLGAADRYEGCLWAKSVDDQIKLMKDLYNSIPDNKKPKRLSMEDIENYEKEMKQDKENKIEEDKELVLDNSIKTGVLNYLDEHDIPNLMDHGSDEDAIAGVQSLSEFTKDILRDVLKVKFNNVSTVDGSSDGKYITTIDFDDKSLDIEYRAWEKPEDILDDVETIIEFVNKNNETLTEDVNTMTPDEYILKETKKALLDRGLDIDLLHETCSDFDLDIQLRGIIHSILYGISFNVNEYVYGQDFDFSLDNKLNLTIDMIEDLDEAKDLPELKQIPRTNGKTYKKIDLYVDGEYWCSTNASKTVKDAIEKAKNEYPELKDRQIKGNFAEAKKVESNNTSISVVERKILDAVKAVNSKYDLSNIKIETTRKGNTHIMSSKGEDIVTIGQLSDDEKEELRLNGYYINN